MTKLYKVTVTYLTEDEYWVEADNKAEAIDKMHFVECSDSIHTNHIIEAELIEDEYAIGENPND